MVDVRGSNPGDLATSIHLGGFRGAAGSPLVAADSVRVDIGHGAVGLEVSSLTDRGPVRGARELGEGV